MCRAAHSRVAFDAQQASVFVTHFQENPMWKILVAFVAFAALAIFVLMKSGGDIDMGGENHGIEVEHSDSAASGASAPASEAAPAASAAASAASEVASAASN